MNWTEEYSSRRPPAFTEPFPVLRENTEGMDSLFEHKVYIYIK